MATRSSGNMAIAIILLLLSGVTYGIWFFSQIVGVTLWAIFLAGLAAVVRGGTISSYYGEERQIAAKIWEGVGLFCICVSGLVAIILFLIGSGWHGTLFLR